MNANDISLASLFTSLSVLEIFCAEMRLATFEAGDSIYRQGAAVAADDRGRLYAIVSGQVQLKVAKSKDFTYTASTRSAGGTIGDWSAASVWAADAEAGAGAGAGAEANDAARSRRPRASPTLAPTADAVETNAASSSGLSQSNSGNRPPALIIESSPALSSSSLDHSVSTLSPLALPPTADQHPPESSVNLHHPHHHQHRPHHSSPHHRHGAAAAATVIERHEATAHCPEAVSVVSVGRSAYERVRAITRAAVARRVEFLQRSLRHPAVFASTAEASVTSTISDSSNMRQSPQQSPKLTSAVIGSTVSSLLERVAAALNPRVHRANHALIVQNCRTPFVFFVVRGAVRLVRCVRMPARWRSTSAQSYVDAARRAQRKQTLTVSKTATPRNETFPSGTTSVVVSAGGIAELGGLNRTRSQGSVSAALRLEAGRVLSNGADNEEANDDSNEDTRGDSGSDDDDHEFCGDHVDGGLNDDGSVQGGDDEDRLRMFRSASRASVSAFPSSADMIDDSESVLVEIDTLGPGDFFGFLPTARSAAGGAAEGSDDDVDANADADDAASVSASSSSSSSRVGRLPRVARSSYSACTASECEIWAVRADALMDALDGDEDSADANPHLNAPSAVSSSSSSSSSSSASSVLDRLRAHFSAQRVSERAVRRALLRGIAWSEYRTATVASSAAAASATTAYAASSAAQSQNGRRGSGDSSMHPSSTGSIVGNNQSNVPPPTHVMAAGESAQVCV
jgi:CRP-like cAMP-binding protein